MNYNIATILAVIAILFVLLTRRAARAGRSHPARAGDYFRGKRIPPGLVEDRSNPLSLKLQRDKARAGYDEIAPDLRK
jgi:hypothetical protein